MKPFWKISNGLDWTNEIRTNYCNLTIFSPVFSHFNRSVNEFHINHALSRKYVYL